MLELIDKDFKITKFKMSSKIEEIMGKIDENMEKINREKGSIKNSIDINKNLQYLKLKTNWLFLTVA